MIFAQLGVALVQLVERLVATQTPLAVLAAAAASAAAAALVVTIAAARTGGVRYRLFVESLRGCQCARCVGLAARAVENEKASVRSR